MGRDIRLSPTHGVNPSVLACPCCGQDSGGLALCGRLPGDAEAPHRMADSEPCAECKRHMALGFLLIEAEPVAGGTRFTGNRWVITHEATQRKFNIDLSKGVAFVEPATAKALGLYDLKPTEGGG